MSKYWRLIAPAAAAGALIATAAIPVASASPAAAATYVIHASSKSAYGKVSGHTLVIYKQSGFRSATVSGTVDGAVTGDVATLWSKPFGAKNFAATSSPVALAPDSETPTVSDYSFSVAPSLATAYEVKVTTGTTVDVTSASLTIYVTEGGKVTKDYTHCSRTACKYAYHEWLKLPASAYKTETRKKFYDYLRVGYPNLPGRYTLDNAAKSRIKKVSSGEFEATFTFSVKLHNGGASWKTLTCVKDTESKDGLGVPGHHGCGDKHISYKSRYIG